VSPKATSPLLAAKSTDEFAPLPLSPAVGMAAERFGERVAALAPRLGLSDADHAFDRRGTATALRALDAAHGGGYFSLDESTETDEAAAAAAFAGDAPVIDVQTHFIDPARWDRPSAAPLAGFLQMVDGARWGDGVDARLIDAAEWATLVFGTSETAVALLTSTPGSAQDNVLTNPQIAAARDIVERYGSSGRVLTHTIVHPNLGPAELEQMASWQAELSPSGWKVYTLYGPPTAASPTGGWFLDDEEIGFPFLEQVRALGPNVVATHKGLGGPIPNASVPAASPRDIGPAAAAFPDIDFVVYHSGYERNPGGEEGAYDPAAPNEGVDRLVASVETAGIGPGGNVYAELGSTWFLMLRRPAEAAHVLGKLLRTLGPDRILWGTDSIWYGSPQPLIDAFRAFQIPESFQEQFGYPALSAGTKEKILSHNARRVYSVADSALADAAGSLGAAAAWVGSASVELRRAISTRS
jgi:predicted TIM-barrel fold metal-dependent hydrolase